MKKIVLFLFVSASLCLSFTAIQSETDGFGFTVDSAKINGSLWAVPYRFEDAELKSVSVKLIISDEQNRQLDLDLISLTDETHKLRMRPTGVYYLRANDKRKYLKAKATNTNYTPFEDHSIENYTNFQVRSFKPNFFGKKKKSEIPSVKSVSKIRVKGKVTYFVDFPVKPDFKSGAVYYKTTKIGTVSIN